MEIMPAEESLATVPLADNVLAKSRKPRVSFPKFGQFPNELKDLIWGFAVSSERLLHFSLHAYYLGPNIKTQPHTQLESLALACRGSRNVVAKVCQPVVLNLDARPFARTLVNYDSDIFYFNSMSEWEFALPWLPWMKKSRFSGQLAQITRAGCSWDSFYERMCFLRMMDTHLDGMCPCELLGELKSLREFVLVEKSNPTSRVEERDDESLVELWPGFEMDAENRKAAGLPEHLQGSPYTIEDVRDSWREAPTKFPCLQPFQRIKITFRRGARELHPLVF